MQSSKPIEQVFSQAQQLANKAGRFVNIGVGALIFLLTINRYQKNNHSFFSLIDMLMVLAYLLIQVFAVVSSMMAPKSQVDYSSLLAPHSLYYFAFWATMSLAAFGSFRFLFVFLFGAPYLVPFVLYTVGISLTGYEFLIVTTRDSGAVEKKKTK